MSVNIKSSVRAEQVSYPDISQKIRWVGLGLGETDRANLRPPCVKLSQMVADQVSFASAEQLSWDWRACPARWLLTKNSSPPFGEECISREPTPEE